MAHVPLTTHARDGTVALLASISYYALNVGGVIRNVAIKDADCKSSSGLETVIDTLLDVCISGCIFTCSILRQTARR